MSSFEEKHMGYTFKVSKLGAEIVTVANALEIVAIKLPIASLLLPILKFSTRDGSTGTALPNSITA
jgi:hypothetical protein